VLEFPLRLRFGRHMRVIVGFGPLFKGMRIIRISAFQHVPRLPGLLSFPQQQVQSQTEVKETAKAASHAPGADRPC
jgi:hypothetical protein